LSGQVKTLSTYHKLPRLYCKERIQSGASLSLLDAQHHYLANVMRKSTGDQIRLFNPKDGEFVATISQVKKKSLTVELGERINAPFDERAARNRLTLHFAPIHKQRMDMIIEKAVELGVSSLQPVITAFTQNRKINAERIAAQIIEASEQCERMDIPELLGASKMTELLHAFEQQSDAQGVLYIALERIGNTPHFFSALQDHAQQGTQNFHILIGPEGGFSQDERTQIMDFAARCKAIRPVHLGALILRAETAAITVVGLANAVLAHVANGHAE
jgi:16S rRNA (uracil1498-N3)-methyltransferase